METNAKAKRGRPTKYSKKLCARLPEMFKNGESVAEVCAALGIWKDTFYNWVKEHPEFSDSYKKGLELSEAWWVKLGRSGSAGKTKIQPATWIFNMKNRFKWTDRQETNISGGLQFIDDHILQKLNGVLGSKTEQAILKQEKDERKT